MYMYWWQQRQNDLVSGDSIQSYIHYSDIRKSCVSGRCFCLHKGLQMFPSFHSSPLYGSSHSQRSHDPQELPGEWGEHLLLLLQVGVEENFAMWKEFHTEPTQCCSLFKS